MEYNNDAIFVGTFGCIDAWVMLAGGCYWDVVFINNETNDKEYVGQIRRTYMGMWEYYDGSRFRQCDVLEYIIESFINMDTE